MIKQLSDLIDPAEVQAFRMFLYELWQQENKYLLKNDLILQFEKFCKENQRSDLLEPGASIEKLLRHTPELIISEDVAVLLHRPRLARYRIYQISIQGDDVQEISTRGLLELRNRLIMPHADDREEKLRINFLPFYDYGPNIKNVNGIGKGIDFLNKHMSSSLFQKPEDWNKRLFEFLKIHSLDNQQLLIGAGFQGDYQQFIEQIETLLKELGDVSPETSHQELAPRLQRYHLEPGWGNTAGRIRETLQLLLDLFQSPDSHNLEKFISRIPMISKIAIISPHGWFGQENVLGRPDTGGQIVYILDQVRALERALRERLAQQGLSTQPKIIVITRQIPDHQDTTCHLRREKIFHTENSFILRVPFTDSQGHVIPQWISRFKLWPYLERFSMDAKTALLSEFSGKPDLIIGNYSDGNLVATRLASQLNVTQCNIAHALEKNKYLFSDLYWQDLESEYHFSLQFSADLIAMNMADFIITSTQQEIAGTEESGGQYESYLFFTMPGLMQVENGINLLHPKFNVIPPGVDENIYFPYHQQERRLNNQTQRLEKLLFSDTHPEIIGHLDQPDKPPIFSMARLDHNKNITGLVESYGKSPALQEQYNLVVIAGKIDPSHTDDVEEVSEIERMHQLIAEYNLDGKIRWLGVHLAKEDAGETYRIMAERQGIFVQPGRFEGFGLTVLEAMVSGLPTFATLFGGPSEIIIDGESGFLINPTVAQLISDPIVSFQKKTAQDAAYWKTISDGGIERVKAHFTWQLYSEQLLNLTALYGFWRYSVSDAGKQELALYCHLLFHLLFKPRAEAM